MTFQLLADVECDRLEAEDDKSGKSKYWEKASTCEQPVFATWISRTGPACWDRSPNTREAFQDTRRTCTSGSCTCTCPQPGI